MVLGVKNLIMIENMKLKRIYVAIILFVISIIVFLLSIDGILRDDIIIFTYIIFIIGLLLFIYSIIFMIKNKLMNYFIFTPLLIVIFCIAGTYYGQIPYNKIYKVAEYLLNNFQGNEYENNLNEIIIGTKIPKKMEIIIINDEKIILYKNLVYLVNRGRFFDVYTSMKVIEAENMNINDHMELLKYIINEVYE
jgi:hypothetical protein